MIIDDLITDRTQADVERLKTLRSIGYADMTAEQRTEYASSKGAYNYTDLNRVGNAMTYIKNLLDQIPSDLSDAYDDAVAAIEANLLYDPSYYDTEILPEELEEVPYTAPVVLEAVKTNWTTGQYVGDPSESTYNIFSVGYIIANLRTLRACIPLSGAPSTPTTLNNMTYKTANDIEKILLAVYNAAVQYRQDKLDAIDQAEIETNAKYENIQNNWIWANEAVAGEF